ncbi:ATP-binding protein [Streptomyces avicenniae]|uniref:ATP-binding protein n=1 Tax=Streptomyces avicenniae TaxID=500153 RepID=UPI000A76DE35|nr:AAA family ATPase [Streptomyces avicenniae]
MFDQLIGREHAAGVLGAEIGRAVTGRGGLVLVTGEPGIGKTSLVANAAEEARSRGVLVLGGSCWDSDNAPGYWPWVQVLRALRRADGGAAPWPPAAAALLAGGTGSGGGEAGARPAGESFELYDAVTTTLVDASHARPVMVVLDDLHWADPASLRLLAFAVQHTGFERLLLVGTYRDAEMETPGHPARDLLPPLLGRATTVSLGGLAPDGVAALIERTAGRPPDQDAAAEVHRRTGGNPFFVEQAARLWHSGGQITAVPPGVRDTVRRRLALLPPEVATLLKRAAVLGRGFHRQVLAVAAGLPGTEVDLLLATAVAARLVTTPDETVEGVFLFAHDLVRETLYASLDEPARRRAHASVVQALHDAPSLADRVPPSDLARHTHLAGDEITPARALGLLLAAAEDATGRMAYEEAVGHRRRAYATATAVGPRDRLLAGVNLAVELDMIGDGAEAWRVLAEVGALARELGDPDLMARVAVAVEWGAGHGRRDAGRSALRAELLVAAHRSLGHDQPPVAPDDHATLRRLASDLSVRTAVRARRGGNDEALGFSLRSRHDAVWGPGTAAERVALTEEMIAVARRTADQDLEHFSMSLRWVALLENGDPAYVAQLADFIRAARRAKVPRFLLGAQVDECVVAIFQGRFEEAEKCRRQVADGGSFGTISPPDSELRGYLEHLRWSQLLARGAYEELEELHRAAGREWTHPCADLLEGITAARRGDVRTAVRLCDAAEARDDHARHAQALRLRLQAATAAATRDPARCARARALLAPLLGTWAVALYGFDLGGPITLWSAQLDAAEERWDDAIGGFTAAAGSADTMGARPWAVEARAGLAAALAARGAPGDAEAAAALRVEVARDAAELGMRHIAAEVTQGRPAGPDAEFRSDGQVWTLRYAGRTVRLPDAKGLRDLRTLLANPGREIPALQLLDPAAGDRPTHGADPVLDDEGRARYRRRLDALDAELDLAAGDAARTAALDGERAALLGELRAAAGLGGRARLLGDEAERARKTVTARIRDSLRRLDAHHPELAAHLRATVTTGLLCAYRPPDGTAHFRL